MEPPATALPATALPGLEKASGPLCLYSCCLCSCLLPPLPFYQALEVRRRLTEKGLGTASEKSQTSIQGPGYEQMLRGGDKEKILNACF